MSETHINILNCMSILGFTYVGSRTYNSRTYAMYKISESNKFGTSGSIGATTDQTTFLGISKNNMMIMSSSTCSSTGNIGYILKNFRDRTGVNMLLPSKTLASQFSSLTWSGWTCTEASESNAYFATCSNGGVVITSKTKTIQQNVLSVVVDLDDAYVIDYNKAIFGDVTIYYDGTDMIFSEA